MVHPISNGMHGREITFEGAGLDAVFSIGKSDGNSLIAPLPEDEQKFLSIRIFKGIHNYKDPVPQI